MHKTVYVLEQETFITSDDYGQSVYEYTFVNVYSWAELIVFLEENNYKYDLNKKIIKDVHDYEFFRVTEKLIKF